MFSRVFKLQLRYYNFGCIVAFVTARHKHCLKFWNNKSYALWQEADCECSLLSEAKMCWHIICVRYCHVHGHNTESLSIISLWESIIWQNDISCFVEKLHDQKFLLANYYRSFGCGNIRWRERWYDLSWNNSRRLENFCYLNIAIAISYFVVPLIYEDNISLYHVKKMSELSKFEFVP